jgi:hypothetical protein
MPNSQRRVELDQGTRAFYLHTLQTLHDSGIPFLVGGAYALKDHAGIERHTKDLDIFTRRDDYDAIMAVLGSRGCETELTYPHWLGKAKCAHGTVDVIFSSGNGISLVDDLWFEHAIPGEALGVPVQVCPPEEMIWSKAFILERERYDGADIMHILLALAEKLDWPRLLERFGPHWRVLLSYVVLFGFVYPSERDRIPGWVTDGLLGRMEHEMKTPPPKERTCNGTLISREQYLVDIEQWGFKDARLTEATTMTRDEVAHWTRAIANKDEH